MTANNQRLGVSLVNDSNRIGQQTEIVRAIFDPAIHLNVSRTQMQLVVFLFASCNMSINNHVNLLSILTNRNAKSYKRRKCTRNKICII